MKFFKKMMIKKSKKRQYAVTVPSPKVKASSEESSVKLRINYPNVNKGIKL